MGKAHGFEVYFYILPVSELAKEGLPPRILQMAEEFRQGLKDLEVTSINEIWTLPDKDFGDPSHVNQRGRAKVTADFLRRIGDERPLAEESETPAQEVEG